jgi:protein TonB
MKRMIQSFDRHASWLAVAGSIVLHLMAVVAMRWHKSQEPVIVEKPPVARVRILANPHGAPQAVAQTAEIKVKPTPPPREKPKPKAKTKTKNKTKLAKKKATKKAVAEKVKEPEAPPPPPNTAPQSFGDNKEVGIVGTGISNTKGPSDPNATTDWLPIEQVKPTMPREAALKGIEGFITFTFDIDEDGRVENIRVTEAENRSVFEEEARRAVRKFRYRPRKVNGRPVRVVGHTFTVVFTLTH